MCLGGPSIKTPPPQQVEEGKDPVYMRNPYLDGLGIGAENRGRNSLRIDAGSGAPNTSAPFLGIAPNPTANASRKAGHRNQTRRFDGGGLNTGLGIS